MIKWLLLFTLPFFTSTKNADVSDHALYLGVLQIEHIQTLPHAKLTVKVFTDDLQNALRNDGSDYTPSSEEACCQINQFAIEQYFKKHISGKINSKPFTFSLYKCQKENDVHFIEFDLSCPEEWNAFEISADFFMELFPTQSNMLQLFSGTEKRFFKMTRGNPFFETYF